MQVYVWLLLPTALLLPPRAWSGEIIGGRVAEPHSQPYMTYLRRRTSTGPKMCGGFLVREDFVLTAAHCAEGNIMVYLGAHNINCICDCSRQKIRVRTKIPHPQYNNTTYNNDIMLLQLKRNARLTNAVRPIKLPPADHSVRPGTVCSVAGWGRTSLTQRPATLREADVTVTRDQTCDSRYRHYNPSTMLCAGDPRDNKTVYKGDSGGPLVCGRVAEGVVSQCRKNSIAPPGVYTRISPFLPWINETMTHF